MKKFAFIVLTLSFVVLTSRCTFTEDIDKLSKLATDSLSLVMGTPQFETGLQLEIKNAKTNDYIRDAEVTVTVTGKNAAYIYNNLGMKSSAYKSKFGIIHLIVDPTKTDSASMLNTPIEFDLQISAPGYNTVTQRFQFDQKVTDYRTINLIKLTDAPEGVVVASSPGFTSSGGNGSTSTTGTLALNGGEQELKIQPGVVLRDASGNAVTGTVTANVIYYDPASENAGDIFPGGLDAPVREGTTQDVVRFEPVGMFNIKLSAGGNRVKTFSNGGLGIRTELPANSINPLTDQPYKVNDQIPMWSREEGSSEWVFEKNAIVKNVNGRLVLEETVTHLSDYLFSDTKRSECRRRLEFNLNGQISSGYGYPPNPGLFRVSVYAQRTNGREELISEFPLIVSGSGRVETYRRVSHKQNAEITKIRLEIESDGVRKLNLSQSEFNLSTNCGTLEANIIVTETITPNPNLLNIDFDLAVSSGPLMVKPTLGILYRETASGNSYDDAMLYNGKGTLSILLDTEYEFLVGLGNNEGLGKVVVERFGASQFKVTFSELSFNGQSDGKPVVFTVEKAADGSLPVSYTAEVDNDIINQLM